jgi:pimeloyl-ACP methyl ester carboxylesterase
MKDVFISGWCGMPELFGDFAGEFEFIVPFVTHSLQQMQEVVDKGGVNLFAWSTGSYLMLEQAKRPDFENIVLVSPFMKFTNYTPAKVVERMIKKFTDAPVAVVAYFFRNCGAETCPVYDPRMFHILLHGLRFLLRTDITDIDWDIDGVTLIHGTDDQIVSIEASRDIHFRHPCRLTEVEGGGHFIPPDILRMHKI